MARLVNEESDYMMPAHDKQTHIVAGMISVRCGQAKWGQLNFSFIFISLEIESK